MTPPVVETPEILPVPSRPPCGPCRARRVLTHDRAAGPAPAAPPADYYVRVRGTIGLYRQQCRACQADRGDTIVAVFTDTPAPATCPTCHQEVRP
jgi:hypothetical protein